jgi:hypothetical protein
MSVSSIEITSHTTFITRESNALVYQRSPNNFIASARSSAWLSGRA